MPITLQLLLLSSLLHTATTPNIIIKKVFHKKQIINPHIPKLASQEILIAIPKPKQKGEASDGSLELTFSGIIHLQLVEHRCHFVQSRIAGFDKEFLLRSTRSSQ